MNSKLNIKIKIEISATLCYCDEFCVRGDTGDCCPDYEPFCKKILAPGTYTTSKCYYKGTTFDLYTKIKDNCNSW